VEAHEPENEGTAPEPSPGEQPQRSGNSTAKVLGDLSSKALALLLTAGGVAAFTAAVGAGILYARFAAAELPADQAVAAIPRGELISTGTTALAGFAVLGGLAVLVVFLIDPRGKPTHGMAYGLLVILSVEWAVTVWLAHSPDSPWQTVKAVAILAGLTAALVVIIERAVPPDQRSSSEVFRDWLSQGPDEQPEEPSEIVLSPMAQLASLGFGILAYALVGKVLGEWWVFFSLVLAGLLALACFRLAAITKYFLWYGVAVFASVAIFGGALGILRAVFNPVVEPAALLRKSGDAITAVEGVWVAETDDRVYLGSLATKGCGKTDLRGAGGRVFWVDKNDVIGVAIGPRQRVNDAASRAPAMAADLLASREATQPKGNAGGSARTSSVRVPSGKLAGAASVGASGQPEIRLSAANAPLRTVDAVRNEPRIIRVAPAVVRPGREVRISGKGFGNRAGLVVIGELRVAPTAWSDRGIRFTVPPAARSGLLRVACRLPTNARRLAVVQKPIALARVTREPATGVYRLDAHASYDPDGAIASYTWQVHGEVVSAREDDNVRLPLRKGDKSVVLEVTDNDARTDSVEVPVR
jgi:hypothetical protein